MIERLNVLCEQVELWLYNENTLDLIIIHTYIWYSSLSLSLSVQMHAPSIPPPTDITVEDPSVSVDVEKRIVEVKTMVCWIYSNQTVVHNVLFMKYIHVTGYISV